MSSFKSYPRVLRKFLPYWFTTARNDFRVYSDDVFLVSYPRAGNTWLRFLLGEIRFGQEIDFDNMENYLPDIYQVSRAHLNRVARPRYIKSHEPYDARYPKVVYLVRDPRDVAISYFYWLLKFNYLRADQFDDFIGDFANNRTRFAGWGVNVSSWHEHRHQIPEGILFVRYEDLLTQTEETLVEILAFLQIEMNGANLREIIARNTFGRMREKEQKSQDTPVFAATRQDIPFVRKGEKQQWREVLTPPQRQRFLEAFADNMALFGYPLND